MKRKRQEKPMKVNIEIDCTPEEARTFLGLPDLAPLHKVYMDRMEELMREGVSTADVDKMMRQWMPMMSGNWDQWQKTFWSAATGDKPGK
jgi:Family of unknown function (DUF6489)